MQIGADIVYHFECKNEHEYQLRGILNDYFDRLDDHLMTHKVFTLSLDVTNIHGAPADCNYPTGLMTMSAASTSQQKE